MRVAKIELDHVGPFDHVEMTIPEPEGEGEIVLFEGPNGAGKTTLLRAICASLEWCLGPNIQHFNRNEIASRMRENGSQLKLQFYGMEQYDKSTQIVLSRNNINDTQKMGKGPLVDQLVRVIQGSKEKISCGFFSYHGTHRTPQMHSDGPRDLGINPLRTALSFSFDGEIGGNIGQFLTNLESARTRALVYSQERNDPQVRAMLEARAKAQTDSLKRMQGALSLVLGWDVRFEFSLDRQAPTVLFDNQPILLDHLGEGLRRTFSWLIDLLARLELIQWEDASRSPLDQEFLLFLDEVDQSLHPTMQMRLMPTLRKLFPRARIYASTHSPFVVASVEDGYVFPIKPDAKTHRVNGVIEPTRLVGGKSLEAVVEEVFDAPATFIDQKTRDELDAHKACVDALRAGKAIDWPAFLEHRRTLRGLGEEVWTVVAMREVPVRKLIEAKVREVADEGVSKGTQATLLATARSPVVEDPA